MDHCGRVVAGILSPGHRLCDDRGAQFVFCIEISAPHALIDRIFERILETFKAHVHADLEKNIDDAGVLAYRPVAFGAHARVGQDLGDGVLGRGRLLALIGAS